MAGNCFIIYFFIQSYLECDGKGAVITFHLSTGIGTVDLATVSTETIARRSDRASVPAPRGPRA